MATETRGNRVPAGDDIPKGCRVFRVTDAMICDSTGAFCATGEWAVLDKSLAKHYLDLGAIRVELPEDFDDDPTKRTDTTIETKTVAVSDQNQAKP